MVNLTNFHKTMIGGKKEGSTHVPRIERPIPSVPLVYELTVTHTDHTLSGSPSQASGLSSVNCPGPNKLRYTLHTEKADATAFINPRAAVVQ